LKDPAATAVSTPRESRQLNEKQGVRYNCRVGMDGLLHPGGVA